MVSLIKYTSLKSCAGLGKQLWKLLRVARKNNIVPQWSLAEGVYIPKEAESQEIGSFRPISLLAVESVVWWDLANAYGSVPHALIKFSREFFSFT